MKAKLASFVMLVAAMGMLLSGCVFNCKKAVKEEAPAPVVVAPAPAPAPAPAAVEPVEEKG